MESEKKKKAQKDLFTKQIFLLLGRRSMQSRLEAERDQMTF